MFKCASGLAGDDTRILKQGMRKGLTDAEMQRYGNSY